MYTFNAARCSWLLKWRYLTAQAVPTMAPQAALQVQVDEVVHQLHLQQLGIHPGRSGGTPNLQSGLFL
jgi:hypothetical protein